MGDNYKEKALSHTVVEKYNNKPSEMTNFVVSTEKCTNMPIDPVILITGLYPSKKIITHVQKKLNVQGC